MKKEYNLEPLRYIMIAKDLDMTRMSEYFECTKAYISAVFSGKRTMNPRTLKYGLGNMGIDYENYIELVTLKQNLIEQNYEQELIHKCMLIKAIGVINPSLKEQTDNLLQVYLNTDNNKKR